MKTRRGTSYNNEFTTISSRKRLKTLARDVDLFDMLHDDIVLSILAKLGSTTGSAAEFINVSLTCKRFNGLALHSIVLANASANCFNIKAKNWSESCHRFLKKCSDSGNDEACYTLGMIRFYCLQNRGSGASYLAKAAIRCHAQALYSLAIIQFNGSGGMKNDKDLRAGVALCARAAFLGHIDSLRELGHCLQDGYGVNKNITQGRRMLIQANARELATLFSINSINSSSMFSAKCVMWDQLPNLVGSVCPLLSDFGCNVPSPQPHPANQFLIDWFAEKLPSLEMRLCSYSGCGRLETRKHEFRRCSVCGDVNYCSRACQALDWKLCHKMVCRQQVNANDIMIVET